MFTLRIKTGNDAMQSPQDIAQALREVIGCLEDGQTSGRILDQNGNMVGHFAGRGI